MRKPLLWHSVSNTGLYALVPPIVVGLLLPAGLLFAGSRFAALYVDYSGRLLVPALAAWWPPFVFKERIEGEGRELLYLLEPRWESRTAISLVLLYWLLLMPFVLVAHGVFDFPLSLVQIILVRSAFVASLTFLLAFVFQSSALALVTVLLFNLVAMMPVEGLVGSLVSTIGGDTSMPTALFYSGLSVVLLWLGEVRSRHFTE